MKKDKRTISFNEQTTKVIDNMPFFSAAFDFSHKVDTIIDDYSNLIAFTKVELINYFTEDEANLLIDSLNGPVFTQYSPKLQV